jgi:hypothetical protein
MKCWIFLSVRISYIFILFIIFLSSNISGETKIWFENKPDYSFSLRNTYIHHKNGKSVEMGYFYTADISELVKDNKTALNYAELADEYDTSAKLIFFPTYLAGMITIISVIPLRTLGDISPNEALGVIGIGTLIAFGGMYISFGHFNKSRHYLFRGINVYNNDVSDSAMNSAPGEYSFLSLTRRFVF